MYVQRQQRSTRDSMTDWRRRVPQQGFFSPGKVDGFNFNRHKACVRFIESIGEGLEVFQPKARSLVLTRVLPPDFPNDGGGIEGMEAQKAIVA